VKIPVFEPELGEEELANVIDCVKTGWISGYSGKYIDEFERLFADYCGCKYGISTTNCATALQLTLESLEIGKGDEVIVPTFTMMATVAAIVKVGAIPVLVDSELLTWNMDTTQIEGKVTKRTKAIMPVHIYGHPCDMSPIVDIAYRHRLFVIEDAAEAHGAEYKGKRTGGLGTVGCFSFYINKIITTGEGGMITTNDKGLADRARLLKTYATVPSDRFLHEHMGFNYRMTNMQAAVGVGQMSKINRFVERKREIARQYSDRLKSVVGIVLPVEMPWAKNVYWVYGIRVASNRRDSLREVLGRKGVETRTFFVPMHKQPCFLKMGLFSGGEYPVSEILAEEGIYLPNSVKLTEDQIDYICGIIKENV
jgi:perosamine synthetase